MLVSRMWVRPILMLCDVSIPTGPNPFSAEVMMTSLLFWICFRSVAGSV